MPTTPFRDLVYRLALPFAAPSPRGQMTHETAGHPLTFMKAYTHILRHHHVLGASLLLTDGQHVGRVFTSIRKPHHHVTSDSLFRVASLTKMATALVTLMLVDDGVFTLDTPVDSLLPQCLGLPSLTGVTLRHLLSHTSGLEDIPAVELALHFGDSYMQVLTRSDIRVHAAGTTFQYCNFGFGLVGCILEAVSGKSVAELFEERLFAPLGLRGSLNATLLPRDKIVPINRVLPYHKKHEVIVPGLGRKGIPGSDPLHHFGYTAGGLYTDPMTMSTLLSLIAGGGEVNGIRLLSPATMAEMTRIHASYGQKSPGMHYGLGVVILDDPALSDHRLLGHQGYAYGCADGAFYEEGTGRQLVFLNGGCSESRRGRLGRCNRDLLRFAFGKELPQWK